jgi:phosphatidylinositol glycan class T
VDGVARVPTFAALLCADHRGQSAQRRIHAMRWVNAASLSLLLASLCTVNSLQVDDEDFQEHLYIRPLPDGKVLSRFEFTTTGSHARWEGLQVDQGIACTRLKHHILLIHLAESIVLPAAYQTSLLPRSLSAIIRSFDVEEVYLSLTAGRWDYTRWGETAGDGSPSGGEIYAWLSNFKGDNDEYVLLSYHV